MRVTLVLLLVVSAVVSAHSAQADDWSHRVAACRTIGDDASRLACYDAMPMSEPRDAAVATPVAEVAPLSAEQRFGLPAEKVLKVEAKRSIAPAEIAVLALKVTSLSLGLGGRVVVGLENGQVWQQLVPGTEFELLKLGDKIEISHGLLGSFWLTAPGKRGAKVTRLR
ncbi:MAG: hypothetical protein WCP04_14800 [Pseudomonadota bacterium]|jgi:hypothetical protein